MEEGAKGKGIVRFRVWHMHDANERKPIMEDPKVDRAEHKETALLRRNPIISRCPVPAGCQGGGIRGEFACVKWREKDVGRRLEVHFDFRLSVGTILHFSLVK